MYICIMKYFNQIALGLLIIIIVQGFFTVPNGISEEEALYMLEVQRLNSEKTVLLKEINYYERTINDFQNQFDSIKNDNSIDTATISQLNDLFTDYLNKRR